MSLADIRPALGSGRQVGRHDLPGHPLPIPQPPLLGCPQHLDECHLTVGPRPQIPSEESIGKMRLSQENKVIERQDRRKLLCEREGETLPILFETVQVLRTNWLAVFPKDLRCHLLECEALHHAGLPEHLAQCQWGSGITCRRRLRRAHVWR